MLETKTDSEEQKTTKSLKEYLDFIFLAFYFLLKTREQKIWLFNLAIIKKTIKL
jgi:hypothetical protein